MKHTVMTAAALAVAAGLTACGKAEPAKTEQPSSVSDASSSAAGGSVSASESGMAGMNIGAAAKMAKASGTVTAVDSSAGTITVDHGPIPEAGWPAMSMAFKAAPGLTGQVKPGDKVSFNLKLEGGSGEITAIQKQ